MEIILSSTCITDRGWHLESELVFNVVKGDSMIPGSSGQFGTHKVFKPKSYLLSCPLPSRTASTRMHCDVSLKTLNCLISSVSSSRHPAPNNTFQYQTPNCSGMEWLTHSHTGLTYHSLLVLQIGFLCSASRNDAIENADIIETLVLRITNQQSNRLGKIKQTLNYCD